MPVVHLHRSTSIPRVNISAANLVCAAYPNNEEAHKLIWGMVVSAKEDPINIDVLQRCVSTVLSMKKL